MNVVLDSSVLVSAFLTPSGTSGALLRLALSDCFGVFLSLTILDEVAKTLRGKARLRARYRYSDEEVTAFVHGLLAIATIVTDIPGIEPVSRDANDDHILAAAVAADAQAIVTGDEDLLVLAEHRGIRILTVRVFVDEISP